MVLPNLAIFAFFPGITGALLSMGIGTNHFDYSEFRVFSFIFAPLIIICIVHIVNSNRKAINQISGEIGYHVTNQASRGDVILEEGSRVIMDADNEVHLEPGVEVKLGATLEVR